MMKTLTLLAASALCFTGSASAQDLGHKAPPQEGPIAIINATVHPISGPVIEDGTLLFNNGKLVEIGSGDRVFTAQTRIIDATGKHVYPGLIGPVTQMGLVEVSAVRASVDTTEIGSVKPEVRAVMAVNPDSAVIPVTRANGILTAGIFPKGGDIPGRAGVIDLDGWTWEDMAVKADAGIVLSWPNVRPVQSRWMRRSEEEQKKAIKESLARIERVFDEATSYLTARDADESTPVDIRYEAMRPIFPGKDGEAPKLPTYIQAGEYDQILSAVAFAERRGLRAVIVGGRDAGMCADVLKEAGVGVIVGGTLNLPKRDDSHYDEPFRLPAELEEKGVRWCLASGAWPHHERNLPYAAAMAAAHGLDHAAALRSITLSAAEILEVDDLLGSLEPGKAATLIVTDGDPLEITTNVEMAFIEGREIDLGNKQKALDEKYREKYKQLGLIK